MRLTMATFLTLDGVYQAPGGPQEDTSGGFPYGGWQVPLVDEDMFTLAQDWLGNAEAFLLGRRTYEIFAAHWPRVADASDPIASRLNAAPKYVVSTTLDSVKWHNSTLIRENVAEEVARLKRLPGAELQVHGSGVLARTLMAYNLVDEYRFWTFPVILGQGRRLLDGLDPAALKLIDTRTTGAGAVIGIYQPAGKPTFGTLQLAPVDEDERPDMI